MPLTTAEPVGFIPTANAEAARTFYEHTLGLPFVAEEPYALVFRVGAKSGIALRVVKMEGHKPTSFTIFGWEVANLENHVNELVQRGVIFERYGFLEQDEHAIWHAPGRAKIAWFKDPDGNTLSLSEHAQPTV